MSLKWYGQRIVEEYQKGKGDKIEEKKAAFSSCAKQKNDETMKSTRQLIESLPARIKKEINRIQSDRRVSQSMEKKLETLRTCRELVVGNMKSEAIPVKRGIILVSENAVRNAFNKCLSDIPKPLRESIINSLLN